MSLHAADWKRLISGLAPMLGTALGGPLIGEAIGAIGGALLGKPDASQGEVAAVLSSGQLSADQVVALQTAEQDFKARMKASDIDLARVNAAADAAEISDTANARSTFGTNESVFRMGVAILSGVAVLMALVLVGSFLLMTGTIEAQQSTLAVVMGLVGSVVGFLAAVANQIVSYFYGSSRGSKDAGQALNTALTDTLKTQSEVLKKGSLT